MKTEPKIGDYVEFIKPYVGRYPVGIVVSNNTRWVEGIKGVNYTKPIYEIHTPSDDPRSEYNPFWRQSSGLKKSSKKRYIEQNILKMLEK